MINKIKLSLIAIFLINSQLQSNDIELEPNNYHSSDVANVHPLYEYPYNLSGDLIKVGIVDEGIISDNNNFDDRLTKLYDYSTELKDPNKKLTVSNHSTHVAGTIGANGNNNLDIKGFAYQSLLYGLRYDNSIKDNYNIMDKFSIKISNHSYGSINSNDKGVYDSSSLELDTILYNDPYKISVFSSGNKERNEERFQLYSIHNLNGSKNVITVGAINHDDKKVADFSLVGPEYDGRIKPDLVAVGEKVASVPVNEKYSSSIMDGTSMAAPAVTGTIALLEEDYERTHINQTLRSDTVKALLINTAEDLETKGPDYKSGWGLINGKKAVDALNSNNLIFENSITQNETIYYDLKVNNDNTKFKTTIAWVDIPSTQLDMVNETTYQLNDKNNHLENNIEIKLIDKYTHELIELPYKLDNSNYQNKAIKGVNNVDNVKQIETTLKKGDYLLVLYGKNIQTSKLINSVFILDKEFMLEDAIKINDKQNFSLVSNLKLLKTDLKNIKIDYSNNQMNELL